MIYTRTVTNTTKQQRHSQIKMFVPEEWKSAPYSRKFRCKILSSMVYPEEVTEFPDLKKKKIQAPGRKRCIN